MADIADPNSTIAQQLADLAPTGKSSEALQLERELNQLPPNKDPTWPSQR